MLQDASWSSFAILTITIMTSIHHGLLGEEAAAGSGA